MAGRNAHQRELPWPGRDVSWLYLHTREPTKSLRGALAFLSRRKLLHQIPRSDSNAVECCYFGRVDAQCQGAAKNKTIFTADDTFEENWFGPPRFRGKHCSRARSILRALSWNAFADRALERLP
jgi:hypothetical protein